MMDGPLMPFPSLMLHSLPLWFLILALFLPRVALVFAWLQGILVPFHLNWLAGPIAAALLPRLLVLFLIYRDQGLSQWFLVHALAGLLVYLGAGAGR